MCLSSERSATSRFKRLVSSMSCRSRRSSLTPRWAYFFFQAWKVASLTPNCRQRSPTGAPRRPGESRTQSVPRKTSTASWVRSFRARPPKPASYSSSDLPSFSGETSIRVLDPHSDSSLDSYLTIQPKQTPEGVFVGVGNESVETQKRLDSSGEEGLVPKAGFEPAHPCGR
jgi:hypothetical protein